MKYIQSINEYLDSDKRTYLTWLYSKIMDEMRRKGLVLSLDDIFVTQLTVGINDNPSEQSRAIFRRIIQKWKKYTLDKDDIILATNFMETDAYLGCEILPKKLKISRVKPFQYVYHQTTKENAASILANGMIPKDSSNWEDVLEYPPAIFAISIPELTKRSMYYKGVKAKGMVTLKIDTHLIPNKWYLDVNIAQHGKIWAKEHNANQSIMTFDAIPASAISIA